MVGAGAQDSLLENSTSPEIPEENCRRQSTVHRLGLQPPSSTLLGKVRSCRHLPGRPPNEIPAAQKLGLRFTGEGIFPRVKLNPTQEHRTWTVLYNRSFTIDGKTHWGPLCALGTLTECLTQGKHWACATLFKPHNSISYYYWPHFSTKDVEIQKNSFPGGPWLINARRGSWPQSLHFQPLCLQFSKSLASGSLYTHKN